MIRILALLLLALSVSLLTGTLVTVFWLTNLYRRVEPVEWVEPYEPEDMFV